MEDTNPDLESFRQQWRAEVSARARQEGNRDSATTKPTRKPKNVQRRPGESSSKGLNDIDEDLEDQNLSGADQLPEGGVENAHVDLDEDGFSRLSGGKEPRSALEHYEKAVERESQGKLGDSLNLYRKAFRVSHFPPLCKISLTRPSWMIK